MAHPSYHDYYVSMRIASECYPFYALLCALFRQADSDNVVKLRAAFPDEMAMFEERYNNPGGLSNQELAKASHA